MIGDLLRIAGLIVGTPAAGWLAGIVIDSALCLRDLRAGRDVVR